MLKDLLKGARSYRSFDRHVSPTADELADFVDHARYAPSSINLQMLKYRVVSTDAECEAVLPCLRFAAKLTDLTLPPKGHEPTAYIVICADTDVTASAEQFQKDVGICAQTVMLASSEAGFGGCMVAAFSKEKLMQALHLPQNLLPQLVLALGKPDEEVCITGPDKAGNVTYYRENGIHYVQKRNLKDLIIK
jgi:nitroreductase